MKSIRNFDRPHWSYRLRGLLALVLAAGLDFAFVPPSQAQDDGLARTPPMGWNSWNRYRLNINDAIIRAQAEALVKSGMKAAGYEYVVIDGGWEGYHDAQGAFRPNKFKFTDMKALCDYIHSLGLKVGIHTTPGPMTCSGREGSYGYENEDAQMFARWGIDFLKYDWCSGSLVYKPGENPQAYEKMHQAILRAGRPMIYNLCQYGLEDVWKWGASVGGHMWRTTEDIMDDYFNMAHIGFEQNGLEKYAGPGHWNDPDMLQVGNGGMNSDEYRTHMSLWCILAAPLFAGNDLTKMGPATLEILTNPEVIVVDQDPAGVQGHRVSQVGPREIWMKPLKDGSKAVGLFNREGYEMPITVDFKDLGLAGSVQVRDLWAHKDLGTFTGTFTATVPTHGVAMIRVK
jgi:alpha-galactosidase